LILRGPLLRATLANLTRSAISVDSTEPDRMVRRAHRLQAWGKLVRTAHPTVNRRGCRMDRAA